MSRRFAHAGTEWDAEFAGLSHGVNTPFSTRFQTVFRRVSDGKEYREHISTSEVATADVNELRAALDRAMADPKQA
jgi:hypothetical protein